MGTASVAVVDDDPNAIEAVELLLANSGRRVVSFASARAAERALGQPDFPPIVLMDLSLPGESSSAAIRLFAKAGRLVIALTSHEEPEFVFEALRAGAIGYLLKHSSRLELAELIDVVEEGGSPITPGVARRILAQFVEEGGTKENGLSDREREILRAFASGLSYKETANAFGISIDTVREHVRRLYSKLGVRSRSGAVLAAMKRGLLG
ncbi:MAG: response regulator transcription factor [Polyangiaceae bacterium]